MANRFTIRHGSGTPKAVTNLLPYELGWNGTNLYINNNQASGADALVIGGTGLVSGYLPLAGGTITGAINRYYSATSTDPIITLRANNVDAQLFQMGHATSATGAITNGYKLVYKGTGSSPNNYFKLIAINSSSVESDAIQINENGVVTLPSTTSLNVNAASSTYASNVRVTATTPTSNTNYYLTFTSGTAADTNYALRVNSLVKVWIAADGASVYLAFGDSTHKGCLTLYSSGGKYMNLETATLATANRTITFPDATGTVALVSNLSAYLPLAGGTLTSTAQISRVGVSKSWYNGRDSATLKNTSISGYSALLSMKTADGSWEMGVYTSNKLHFAYVPDTSYNDSTNTGTMSSVYLTPDGSFYAPKVYHAVWN